MYSSIVIFKLPEMFLQFYVIERLVFIKKWWLVFLQNMRHSFFLFAGDRKQWFSEQLFWFLSLSHVEHLFARHVQLKRLAFSSHKKRGMDESTITWTLEYTTAFDFPNSTVDNRTNNDTIIEVFDLGPPLLIFTTIGIVIGTIFTVLCAIRYIREPELRTHYNYVVSSIIPIHIE